MEEWSYFPAASKVYLDEYSVYHSNGRVTRTKYRSDGSVRSITNYNTDGNDKIIGEGVVKL